jgi:hypothetical protein
MEKYDKLIGDNTSYIVGQARLLHENFVEDTRPDAVATYNKKLLEIIGVFNVGLQLAEKRGRRVGGAGRSTRKRKARNE